MLTLGGLGGEGRGRETTPHFQNCRTHWQRCCKQTSKYLQVLILVACSISLHKTSLLWVPRSNKQWNLLLPSLLQFHKGLSRYKNKQIFCLQEQYITSFTYKHLPAVTPVGAVGAPMLLSWLRAPVASASHLLLGRPALGLNSSLQFGVCIQTPARIRV